jgi:hypothetical protein
VSRIMNFGGILGAWTQQTPTDIGPRAAGTQVDVVERRITTIHPGSPRRIHDSGCQAGVQKPLSPQLHTARTGRKAPCVIELCDAPRPRPARSLVGLTRTSHITATDIAWCAQVDRARRASWATDGSFKRQPPFTEHDALETAIAFSLTRGGVSQKIARTAWGLIRSEVKRLLIAGEREIWVVVSMGGPRAWAFASAEGAASRAAGEGPCWIVATSEAVQEARVRYGQLTAQIASAPGGIARLPSRPRIVRSTQ